MTIEEVEEGFNFAQLVIMSTIQSIDFEHRTEQYSGRRILNKGGTAEERNRKAWSKL